MTTMGERERVGRGSGREGDKQGTVDESLSLRHALPPSRPPPAPPSFSPLVCQASTASRPEGTPCSRTEPATGNEPPKSKSWRSPWGTPACSNPFVSSRASLPTNSPPWSSRSPSSCEVGEEGGPEGGREAVRRACLGREGTDCPGGRERKRRGRHLLTSFPISFAISYLPLHPYLTSLNSFCALPPPPSVSDPAPPQPPAPCLRGATLLPTQRKTRRRTRSVSLKCPHCLPCRPPHAAVDPSLLPSLPPLLRRPLRQSWALAYPGWLARSCSTRALAWKWVGRWATRGIMSTSRCEAVLPSLLPSLLSPGALLPFLPCSLLSLPFLGLLVLSLLISSLNQARDVPSVTPPSLPSSLLPRWRAGARPGWPWESSKARRPWSLSPFTRSFSTRTPRVTPPSLPPSLPPFLALNSLLGPPPPPIECFGISLFFPIHPFLM